MVDTNAQRGDQPCRGAPAMLCPADQRLRLMARCLVANAVHAFVVVVGPLGASLQQVAAAERPGGGYIQLLESFFERGGWHVGRAGRGEDRQRLFFEIRDVTARLDAGPAENKTRGRST